MTSDAQRPAQRRLVLSYIQDSPFGRIIQLAGEHDLADSISRKLDRYLALLHHTGIKLADHELCAVIDALGEHWAGDPHQIQSLPQDVALAVTADRLDAKWELDAAQLKQRLDRTPLAERTAIAEFCIAYWSLAQDNEYPQATLARIRHLIRPNIPHQSTSTQRRRVSHLDFKQATSLPEDHLRSGVAHPPDSGGSTEDGPPSPGNAAAGADAPGHPRQPGLQPVHTAPPGDENDEAAPGGTDHSQDRNDVSSA